jgi:hypothetical protein
LGAIARRSGSLLVPLQDAATAAAGANRAALIAGLSAADTSTSDIRIAGPSGDRTVGALPTALHDAAAARLGAFLYLFGGGDGVTQHAAIVRIDPTTWHTSIVGNLPAPSSDQSSAVIGGSAYIVGGYTGSNWLDTIVRFRPSTGAQVVAHLPTAVRYAAVTAVDGTVVIAGGSLPDGRAGTVVYAYRPGGHVSRIGNLPAATTHATAAAIGRLALIIGGRGGASDSQSSRIVAVDPADAQSARSAHSGRRFPTQPLLRLSIRCSSSAAVQRAAPSPTS